MRRSWLPFEGFVARRIFGGGIAATTNAMNFSSASCLFANWCRVSNEFLRGQINDLMNLRKQDIEDRRKEKEETDKVISELKHKQLASDKLIIEQRKELLDWKDWATRLNHQLISVGETPVPFLNPRQNDNFLDDIKLDE